MKKSLMLKLIKTSNLKSTTKSFLFEILKSSSAEGKNTVEFDVPDEQSTLSPESSKPSIAESSTVQTSTVEPETDNGVSATDSLLTHAADLSPEDYWQLDFDSLATIQPWEEEFGSLAYDKYMEGTPLTDEEKKMVKRLADIERLRKARYDQMVRADFNDPVQVRRWRAPQNKKWG